MNKTEEKLIAGWIGRTLFEVAPGASEELQAELTQEGWVSALQAYESFDPEGGTALQNWIITYLKRDMVRFIENELKHEHGHDDIMDWVEVEDIEELLDTDAERLDNVIDVQHLVEKLPEREANVVEMYYFEDRSENDIAGTIGVSRSVVRKLRYRALDRLRQEINQDEGGQ